jgi:hypothetical protein
MNERMLELYRLAHVPHTAIDPSNNMPYETNHFSADKFAELLVKECQLRVEQYINECGEVASMPDTVIMKHFGVTE